MSFNKLTPAEAERLALLAEECAEVVAIVGKILRHGYESCNPNDCTGTNNRVLLERELGDVSAAVEMMVRAGDVDAELIICAERDKAARVGQYLHHQDVTP